MPEKLSVSELCDTIGNFVFALGICVAVNYGVADTSSHMMSISAVFTYRLENKTFIYALQMLIMHILNHQRLSSRIFSNMDIFRVLSLLIHRVLHLTIE